MTIDEAAAYIIQAMKENDVAVQRYDSQTSNSVYLKMDFGILGSSRISDHRGIRRFRYKYNVREDLPRIKREGERLFLPIDKESLNIMIVHILSERREKVNRYTEKGYLNLMAREVQKNKNKRGFWSKCRIE